MLLVAARGLVQLVGALRLLATGVSEGLFSGGHVRPVGAAVVPRMLAPSGASTIARTISGVLICGNTALGSLPTTRCPSAAYAPRRQLLRADH